MSADFEQVMAQCSRGCFTGLLRVRTRQGNGEIRFLSGIQDGIRFDAVEGDAALERLLAASELEFEAISSLPPIDYSSTEPVPVEGSLSRFHAAQLMRYCESNSLTCALELEVEGTVLTARYRLGELLSVEPDSEHTARLAEAKVGLYRFRLPRFELPANVQQRRSPPPPAKAAASKPAPAAPARSPAPSQAETPLMGVRSVAVSTPGASPASPAVAARAPSAPAPARSPSPSVPAPSAPASRAPASAPAKVAAAAPPSSGARATDARSGAGPARSITIAGVPSPANTPAAAARRNDARSGGTLIGASPPNLKPLEPRQAAPASQSAPTPAVPPVAPAAAVSAGPVTPPSTRPRSPLPPQPASTSQQPAAPLQGLWAEAVKPPPQSAPLELGSPAPAAPAKAAPGSTPKAARDAVTAVTSRGTDEPVKSSQRQRGSAKYWLVAIALLIVLALVAGYFLFGR
jgi:hypothetical protein